ncbi:hypothetical protein [Dysgonomonas macrotermitis]|uniref:C1q domain-containing protein n=1 Tax=Dysgonomonas macrotermitis TaxID=1346286 RepID=A0A1M5D7B5_9BACT|nr:hypothetical protein [Dysgonomonas macrotermitis]SHF62898.1 hypothetical protein SAMN05444362_10899 [Dysgonomonas macrotermitis]
MKKIILYLYLSLSIGIIAHAQIGVNTESPIGIFNIDPKGNNNSEQTGKSDDDVVILTNGNMGIGTTTPSNKLTIVPATNATNTNAGLQLTNNAANDRVLTSDINGNAQWTGTHFSEFTIRNRTSTNLDATPAQLKYVTGLSFTFPSEGTYSVTLQCIMRRVSGTLNLTDRPVLQILPNVPTSATAAEMESIWSSNTEDSRFLGSYEIMGYPRNLAAATNTEYRFIFSENLIVTQATGLTAYLIVHMYVAENQTFQFQFGTPSTGDNTEPQTVGCSFIKIN